MVYRLTQEQYEDKVRCVNPNITVLGKYINSQTKLLHKCLKEDCGYEWMTTPHIILRRKSGCPKCSYKTRFDSTRLTQDEYVNRVKNIAEDIEVLGEYISSNKPLEHKCKKCGHGSNHEWFPHPSHILNGHGCPVCSGNVIGSSPEYKNSIWSQKEYYNYFKDYMSDEQMKFNMPNSHAKINMTCPNCGRGKDISPNSLWRQGFGCVCSDGVSYPNKFMFSFLEQTGIDFDRERSFKWSDRKIYDFYIPSLDCIIECHGEQHYRGWNHDDNSLIKEQINDNYKKQLAITNGIKECNYIVVDCSKSNMNYIKNSIVQSGLLNLLDRNICDIDLNSCNEFANNSNMKRLACDMWNNGCSVKDIKNKLKISSNAVISYLKAGSEFGWCNNYTNKESRKRSSIKYV